MCLLSHSQLQKVPSKHPLIFLDVSLYYSSSGIPEPYFCLGLEKTQQKTRAKSVSTKNSSNTNLIQEATDECSSRLQGIETAYLQKSHRLFRRHPHSSQSYWLTSCQQWILQSVCSFKDLSIYQHFKNKRISKAHSLSCLFDTFFYARQICKKPDILSSLHLCTHRAVQIGYINTRIRFSWSVFDYKNN